MSPWLLAGVISAIPCDTQAAKLRGAACQTTRFGFLALDLPSPNQPRTPSKALQLRGSMLVCEGRIALPDDPNDRQPLSPLSGLSMRTDLGFTVWLSPLLPSYCEFLHITIVISYKGSTIMRIVAHFGYFTGIAIVGNLGSNAAVRCAELHAL